MTTSDPAEGSHGNLSACGDWPDPRGHAPVGVFWECQNSAQRQFFTFWQIHANLHGGVSSTKNSVNINNSFANQGNDLSRSQSDHLLY